MPSGYTLSERPSHYQPLFDYLAGCPDDEVVLTFKEIATLIGRRTLPESAILRTAWWTNKRNGQVQAWQALGWKAHAERDNLRVRFTRDAEEG
jgi:hypothetical protein